MKVDTATVATCDDGTTVITESGTLDGTLVHATTTKDDLLETVIT
jgi:hypothetical protein